MAYPATLDNLSEIVDRELVGGVWVAGTKWEADVVNPWIVAINAIEETLGVNPQGAYDDVAARLDAFGTSNHPQLHNITSGSDHSATGLTPGHFMKAVTPTSFGFAAHGLTYTDVGAAASGHNHGTGTTNKHAKWTSSTAIGDSICSDDGSTFTVTGDVTYTGKFAVTKTLPALTSDHHNKWTFTGVNSTNDYGAMAFNINGYNFMSNTGTGVDVSLSSARTAFKCTLGSATNLGMVRLRLKKSAYTADSVIFYLKVYSDDGGSPSKPSTLLYTGGWAYAGNLSSGGYTSVDLSIQASSPGATFWVSIEPSTYASNPIITDSVATGSNQVATYDGANWNLTTGTIYGLLYAGTPLALSMTGDTYTARFNSTGTGYTLLVYSTWGTGISSTARRYGVYGSSTGKGVTSNGAGVRGDATDTYGGYFVSTNYTGVYGQSTAHIGVWGESTYNWAGYFSSTGGSCLYAQASPGGASSYVMNTNRAGTLTATISGADIFMQRSSTLGVYDLTGPMMTQRDTTAASGRFYEIQKYSSALTTTNTVFFLTHDNAGRTVTQRMYGYDTGAVAWKYWDVYTYTDGYLYFKYNGTTQVMVMKNDHVLVDVSMRLKEIATPTSLASYGTLYVSSTTHLPSFLDNGGTGYTFVATSRGLTQKYIPYCSGDYGIVADGPLMFDSGEGILACEGYNFILGDGFSLGGYTYADTTKSILELTAASSNDHVRLGMYALSWGTTLDLYSGTSMRFYTNCASGSAALALTFDTSCVGTFTKGIITLKGRITDEGGYAVLLTAGETLAQGEVVIAKQGETSGRVYKCPTTGDGQDMPIGVVYAAAAAAGDPVWVVVSGRCDVLPEAAVTLTYGYIIYASSATAGRVAQSASKPADADHWREVGHVLENGTGAGNMAKCIIHFN